MKDSWDKFKISSDAIKDNKWLLLMGLTAFSSGMTNLGQMIYGEEKDVLNEAMKEQITFMAKAAMPEPKKTKVIIKSNCTDCRTMWLDDIGKESKKLENKLEDRYHR